MFRYRYIGIMWYFRFYVEDESGRQVQREFAGTESKSETEALLRRAMEDYEVKKFVTKSENTTVGQLLDLWVEEELKPGNLSNGTVMAYQGTVMRIKQYPIGSRRLKSVTPDHLQAYIDFLSFGGTNPDGTTAKALSKGYLRQFSAVLQGASASRYSPSGSSASTLCSMWSDGGRKRNTSCSPRRMGTPPLCPPSSMNSSGRWRTF